MVSHGKERHIGGVIGEVDKVRLQPFETFAGVESVVQSKNLTSLFLRNLKKKIASLKLIKTLSSVGLKSSSWRVLAQLKIASDYFESLN